MGTQFYMMIIMLIWFISSLCFQYFYLKNKFYAEKVNLDRKFKIEKEKLEKEFDEKNKYFLSRMDDKDKILLQRCHDIEKLTESKMWLEEKIKIIAAKLRQETKRKEMYKQRVYRREKKIEKIKNKNSTNK